MPRIARVVVPHIPHHITQRGVRRMDTFFEEEDYKTYLRFMGEWCLKAGVDIWAYCLMTNHIHLIAVPKQEDSLARGIGEAHRRYTCHINAKNDWKGYLWQGRFASFPMDERYLLAACRYVELNPVRANMVKCAEEYRWSSARAHLNGVDDDLVKVEPMLERARNWAELLATDEPELFDDVRLHARTGRPLGQPSFVERVSGIVGRDLVKKKAGRKHKTNQ